MKLSLPQGGIFRGKTLIHYSSSAAAATSAAGGGWGGGGGQGDANRVTPKQEERSRPSGSAGKKGQEKLEN
jgi:hypothetical protein